MAKEKVKKDKQRSTKHTHESMSQIKEDMLRTILKPPITLHKKRMRIHSSINQKI